MSNNTNNNTPPLWYLQNVIANLPKTEAQVRNQKIFDVVMAILIFIPIIFCGILVSLNQSVAAVIVLVACYLSVLILGFCKRKSVSKGFYNVASAHNLITMHEADEAKVKELCDTSALTFMMEPSDELLDFIYNWLNNENVLVGGKLELDMYTFDGRTLKRAYRDIQIESDARFLSIFLKDLDINDSNKNSFLRDRMTVGARWLDDIVENSK